MWCSSASWCCFEFLLAITCVAHSQVRSLGSSAIATVVALTAVSHHRMLGARRVVISVILVAALLAVYAWLHSAGLRNQLLALLMEIRSLWGTSSPLVVVVEKLLGLAPDVADGGAMTFATRCCSCSFLVLGRSSSARPTTEGVRAVRAWIVPTSCCADQCWSSNNPNALRSGILVRQATEARAKVGFRALPHPDAVCGARPRFTA